MDKFRIDSHKLIYHPKVVSDWYEGKDITPIYIEISPVSRCNHRCIFCSFEYLGYTGLTIKTDKLLKFVEQAKQAGVKSMMLAGEGEPLLHPDIVDIVQYIKNSGIDVAITTNGVPFNERIMTGCLPYLSWIKFSLDAGNSKTYSYIHGCKEKDFDTVIDNVTRSCKYRNSNNLSCSIGIQMLLINDNKNELYEAGLIAKNSGVDYFVVKPYTEHPLSDIRLVVDYSTIPLREETESLSDDNFSVIIRDNAMSKKTKDKGYVTCYGYRFWSYLSSNGDLYSCSAFLGNDKFCYGNIYYNSYEQILNSARKREVDKRIASTDVDSCRRLCRLDEINKYLWELKHPPVHVNFI